MREVTAPSSSPKGEPPAPTKKGEAMELLFIFIVGLGVGLFLGRLAGPTSFSSKKKEKEPILEPRCGGFQNGRCLLLDRLVDQAIKKQTSGSRSRKRKSGSGGSS